MKIGEFELETMHEIWGNDGVIEVGPDRDGLDLIEIRLKEKMDGELKILARITMRPEQAQLVGLAITKYLNDKAKDSA